MEAFQDTFDLSAELKRAILDMGYEQPTPIQLGSIPPMLLGRDIIGQAQTGTGKTAAFGIPLVNQLDVNERHVQAIVLCPTRELCVQTAGELTKLARYRAGLNTLAVYGGQPIERQLRGLAQGAQVVVGTPGRVIDHMNRGSLDLTRVRIAVLDEADEMLDMGFRDDIESILKQTPESRQTALFSATMPREIMVLGRRYLKNPEHIQIQSRELTVDKIAQSYLPVRSFHKLELLARLLVKNDTKLALVFCNTKRGVEDVVTQLVSRGFTAAGLHGDMRQIERDAIMARFRQGMVSILVATDVAARGLDIDDIEVVFNYDLPLDVEYYVHRIGRTGRAGKEGRAYSFVTGQEVARMWEYRRITGAKILCEQPPSGEEMRRIQTERKLAEVRSKLTEEHGDTSDMAKQLLESGDAERLVAAMLSMLLDQGDGKVNSKLDIRLPEPARAPKGDAARPFAPTRRGPYGQGANRDPQRRHDRDHRKPYGGYAKNRAEAPRAGKPYSGKREDNRRQYPQHQG